MYQPENGGKQNLCQQLTRVSEVIYAHEVNYTTQLDNANNSFGVHRETSNVRSPADQWCIPGPPPPHSLHKSCSTKLAPSGHNTFVPPVATYVTK